MLAVGLEFHFIYDPCSNWRAGNLDQFILLVWPNRASGRDKHLANTHLLQSILLLDKNQVERGYIHQLMFHTVVVVGEFNARLNKFYHILFKLYT